MERKRADRILDEWNAVASQARRPAAPPRPVVVRSGLSSWTLAGASVAAAALVVAAIWLSVPKPNGRVGGSSPSPDPTASADATATPVPTLGPCDPANLSARITLWEGAMGHRIAHVELANAGPASCTMGSIARPQLVDGRGSILIDGASPSGAETLTVAPGEVLTTLVQDGNYCGPDPAAPVTVAFDLGDGSRIVASPFSSTDATVPPCMGSGSPASIEMQPWAR